MKLRSSNAKQTQPIGEYMQTLPSADETAGTPLDRVEMVDLMVRCLDDLNMEQKLCVTLFYLEKQSYQEIAEKTGYTMMQVKSYIQNGKRNLKIMLDRTIEKHK
jgi:RNA polymerase sigma-70 factor (ECF subfamily)